MSLKFQTEQLKQHLEVLKDRFEDNKPPASMSDKHFFLKMKEETSPIYNLLEQWEEDTLQLVKNREINVHPHQVASTRENMELLLLHSYYVDARRKRYMELNHSCHYIFDQLLREIKGNFIDG